MCFCEGSREYIDTLDEREKCTLSRFRPWTRRDRWCIGFSTRCRALVGTGRPFWRRRSESSAHGAQASVCAAHAAYSAFDTLEATVKAHVEQRDAKHFQMLREQEDVFSTVLKGCGPKPGRAAAGGQGVLRRRVAKRLPKMNPRQVVGYFPHEMQGSKLIVYQRKLVRLYVDFQALRTRDRLLKPGEEAPERLAESGPKKMAMEEIKRVYSHMSEVGIQALMMQDSQRRTSGSRRVDLTSSWRRRRAIAQLGPLSRLRPSAPFDSCTATKEPITTPMRARLGVFGSL